VDVVIDHLERFGRAYAQGFLAAVPEPGAIVPFAAFGGAAAIRRRRRRVANLKD
jgi:hypothetical protein